MGWCNLCLCGRREVEPDCDCWCHRDRRAETIRHAIRRIFELRVPIGELIAARAAA